MKNVIFAKKKYMMKRIKLLLLIGMVGIVFSSCYKDLDTGDIDTYDITLTYYDTEFEQNQNENFQTYKTFIIRDSVGVISDYVTDDELNKFWSPSGKGPQIRQAIRAKFLEKGYVQVDNLEDADFGVNIVVSLIQNTAYVGYPGWWYGWGGYWGWGWDYGYYKSANTNKSANGTDYYGGYWGGYYPYYPYWGYASYTYETGTVMIEMIDGQSLRDFYDFMDGKTEDEIADTPPDSIPELKYRWQSFINGTISNYDEYDSDRFNRGVEESFDQSPYIHTSK